MVIQIVNFENSDLPGLPTPMGVKLLYIQAISKTTKPNTLETLITELPVHYEAKQALEMMSLSSTFVHINKDTQVCFVGFVTFLSTLKLNFDISNMHRSIN